MTWDESKHPRDEKGQFTYSDGSDSESNTENDTSVLKGRIEKTEKSKSPADILYGDAYEKEKQEKEYRSKLLNVLGNLATPAMILYATTKELENTIKENGLGKKINEVKQVYGAIDSFKQNYHDIKEANTKNADKYFHAKANCEAAQYGLVGAKTAEKLSDFRENTDLVKNKFKKKKDGTKMTTDEIIKDYRDDQQANIYGRYKGLQNKDVNCKILVNKYRPNGLDKKY